MLKVTVIRCEGLSLLGLQDKSVDPYVALRLFSPEQVDEKTVTKSLARQRAPSPAAPAGPSLPGGIDLLPIASPFLALKDTIAPATDGLGNFHEGSAEPGGGTVPISALGVKRTERGAYLYKEHYHQTSTQLNSPSPVYDEEFKFVGISPESRLQVEVHDVPMKSAYSAVQCIGTAALDVAEIVKKGAAQKTLTLKALPGSKDPTKPRGKILLSLKYTEHTFLAETGGSLGL
jgi:hypothetical protein